MTALNVIERNVTQSNAYFEEPFYDQFEHLFKDQMLPFHQRDDTVTVITMANIGKWACRLVKAVINLATVANNVITFFLRTLRILVPIQDCLAILTILGRNFEWSNYHLDRTMLKLYYFLFFPCYTVYMVLKMDYFLYNIYPALYCLIGREVQVECGYNDLGYAIFSLVVWTQLRDTLPEDTSVFDIVDYEYTTSSKQEVVRNEDELECDATDDFGGWEESWGEQRTKGTNADELQKQRQKKHQINQDQDQEQEQEQEQTPEGHLDFEEEMATAIKTVLDMECELCKDKSVKCTDRSSPLKSSYKSKRSNPLATALYSIVGKAPSGKAKVKIGSMYK